MYRTIKPRVHIPGPGKFSSDLLIWQCRPKLSEKYSKLELWNSDELASKIIPTSASGIKATCPDQTLQPIGLWIAEWIGRSPRFIPAPPNPHVVRLGRVISREFWQV